MKKIAILLIFSILVTASNFAQQPKKEIVITGVRFTYPLIQQWIEDYKKIDPSITVRLDPRTNVDPSQYDILIEAYEHEKEVQLDRDYFYLGQYAVVPVANAQSAFAQHYAEKGLTADEIKKTFFHDIYASKNKEAISTENVTVYTRLQKAGAPKTFAHYFGFEQEQIKGKAIAGADEHLIKALLKDTTGVSYATLGLIYDLETRQILSGLRVIPVDVNDNGRVSKDEDFYGSLDEVLQKLETTDVKNIPIAYLHLSVAKHGRNPDTIKFLLWLIDNGLDDLHQFGFLKPEPKRFEAEKQKFQHRASK